LKLFLKVDAGAAGRRQQQRDEKKYLKRPGDFRRERSTE